MRLREFIQPLEELATVTHRNEMDRLFKQNGYKKIGSGADAMVYKKDSSHVIKILFPEDYSPAAKAIRSFTTFYEFVKANPTSPFLPKISEVNEIEVMGEVFTQIAMEKLMPLKSGSFLLVIVYQIISDIEEGGAPGPKGEGFKNLLLYLQKHPANWDNDIPFDDRHYNMSPIAQSILANPAKLKFYSDFYDIAEKLHATGLAHPDGPLGWDLHTENVMLRGQTPVIIDPWFMS